MDDLLNNEPVKRAQEALKKFDNSLNVKVLEKTARTAQDASLALGCEVGAIVKSLLFRAENSFVLTVCGPGKRIETFTFASACSSWSFKKNYCN